MALFIAIDCLLFGLSDFNPLSNICIVCRSRRTLAQYSTMTASRNSVYSAYLQQFLKHGSGTRVLEKLNVFNKELYKRDLIVVQ